MTYGWSGSGCEAAPLQLHKEAASIDGVSYTFGSQPSRYVRPQ